jgi:hypothetical protein
LVVPAAPDTFILMVIPGKRVPTKHLVVAWVVDASAAFSRARPVCFGVEAKPPYAIILEGGDWLEADDGKRYASMAKWTERVENVPT